MPSVVSLDCPGCGAPLPDDTGRELRCAYCGRRLAIDFGSAHIEGEEAADATTDALLGGPRGRARGRARRCGAGEAAVADWRHHDTQLWPTRARASSNYGGAWGAHALVGPPRVFPRYGDIGGSWAPRASRSRVEWVETDYPAAPAARAVRIFETCNAGATYAVSVWADGVQSVIWEGPPSRESSARILEIELDPPRRVDKVRAYVNNQLGSGWAEIDTIGLVMTEPLDPAIVARQRAHARAARSRSSRMLVLMAALLAMGAAIAVFVAGGGGSGGREATEPLTRPAIVEVGAQVRILPGPPAARWATDVIEYSSQYDDYSWAADQVLGAPDVYPRHGDLAGAWASRNSVGGTEWITVEVPQGTARGVVVVETNSPGAVVRLDDLSGPEPVLLWEGSTPVAYASRVLQIDLPRPRPIHRLRLVLDTTRAPSWNEIDALGVVE